MVNRNLLRQVEPSEDELQQELDSAFGADQNDWLPPDGQEFRDNKLVTGRVLRVTGDGVWVDVGYKSEGAIELREWYDEDQDKVVPPQPGDQIEVFLESVQDEGGGVVLSYRKAKRQKEWEQVIQKYKEGDTVSGIVTRKIKGGLLVNIGAHVFLPASQVDVRRPADIGLFIGKTIECKILIIDEARHNIVVSRRKLIEDQRTAMKEKLLSEIQVGQIRKGVVKNIADFGAFVDLGGIDGLLHITDMDWGRVANPRDVVHLDQELEVYIIRVDKEKEKIALGLKQKTPSPWESIEQKYPIGSRHTGEVVNVMSYGAFVKLEPGVEGLVHISEMSWTKRINHPSEVVASGEQVEVQILNLNKEKHEISLGIKQVQPDPWTKVAERYPAGTQIEGIVRNLTNSGAFLELEEGSDGLLHVSDMSWVRKVSHPGEVVNKGDKVTCVVLNVDRERKRIALGMKQMASDPWEGDIPARFHPGQVKTGKVTKLTNFGVFVELEPGLEGLLHISELADHKVDSPEAVVKVGDEIEVKVLRVDPADRKIGLSRKQLSDGPGEGEEEAGAAAGRAAPAKSLRGGTGSGGGALFSLPGQEKGEGAEAPSGDTPS
ncbi:MAG: 30S ribosomal protein S1 [Planctomycetia bacterium]|nr:30S ribosomal protein S1 [Planctomycetia bacterium]